MGEGIWVTIFEGEKELKRLEDYAGPLPQIGQKITFLSGKGIFEVADIRWVTSEDDWYNFTCYIQVKKCVL